MTRQPGNYFFSNLNLRPLTIGWVHRITYVIEMALEEKK